MKYEFIHTNRSEFVVEKMCRVLDVSRSGYYRYTVGEVSQRSIDNMVLLTAIKVIHKQSHHTYGGKSGNIRTLFRKFFGHHSRVISDTIPEVLRTLNRCI